VASDPPAPRNVRAVLADGTEFPIECVYAGIDPETGAHLWDSVRPVPRPAVGVRAEVLPANTAIRVDAVPLGPCRHPSRLDITTWTDTGKRQRAYMCNACGRHWTEPDEGSYVGG
jgi:hypothetical protein